MSKLEYSQLRRNDLPTMGAFLYHQTFSKAAAVEEQPEGGVLLMCSHLKGCQIWHLQPFHPIWIHRCQWRTCFGALGMVSGWVV